MHQSSYDCIFFSEKKKDLQGKGTPKRKKIFFIFCTSPYNFRNINKKKKHTDMKFFIQNKLELQKKKKVSLFSDIG